MNLLSLLSGFLVIFTGVYLLNLSREDPDGQKMLKSRAPDGVPTDGITGLQTRRSMQTRRSGDGRHSNQSSISFGRSGERGVLMHSYEREEEELGLGMGDLAEASDEDENYHHRRNGKPPQSTTHEELKGPQ